MVNIVLQTVKKQKKCSSLTVEVVRLYWLSYCLSFCGWPWQKRSSYVSVAMNREVKKLKIVIDFRNV